jgi:L-iditol 2-dehydrogenase
MNLRKSVVWDRPEKLIIKNLEIPEIKSGQVLLKVQSCAICGSDLRILKHGNPRVESGRIVGHEISGIIEKTGVGVTKFKIGDRVSVGADVPCGDCVYCLSDRANCCDINYAIGHQFEGGFTQYMVLNDLTVRLGPINKINNDISYDLGALAEPLACCINGFERAYVRENSNIVIFGAGPIGLMLGKLAKSYKAKNIIIIDPQENRLNLVKRILDDVHIINPKSTNTVKKVKEITGDFGGDFIFTACPSIDAHQDSIEMIAKRGVINLFGGLPKDAPTLSFYSNLIHYKEAYITGSHGSTPAQHARAVKMINAKEIDLGDFITHKYNLGDINEAYKMAASGNAVKVIVKPNW